MPERLARQRAPDVATAPMLAAMASGPEPHRTKADARWHSPPGHPESTLGRPIQRDPGTPAVRPGVMRLATAGDGGARRALFAGVARTAGNAAAAQLAGSRPTGVQRDAPEATPAAGQTAGPGAADAAAKYVLTNARFTGQPRLQQIAEGGPPLSKTDPKAVVKPAQTALLDIGYTLLRYKDDGKFGGETSTAIEQFRADSGISEGDGLDAAAIKVLDKRAPAPGKLEQHYLDYGRLFADNRLDVTLALGYDEGGSHVQDLEEARKWLGEHKLAIVSGGEAPKAPGVGEAVGDAAKKKDPISVPEKWEGKWKVTYPDATGTRISKEITLSITLVPPGTGAKASFAKGLNESELTLYSGHARRGIGPDFDADKSPYENFVIGVNSALHKAGRLVSPTAVEQSHYVVGKKNDLEEMKAADKWDKDKYRVWFFAACSSIAYVDELRGGLLPEKMDRHNLDIFGTIHTIPIAAGLTPVFSNLEGILAAETMEQIVDRMQRSSLEAFRKRLDETKLSDERKAAAMKEYSGQMFMREGAGDNPVAPQAP
jgi:hypothetical protein